MKPVALLRAAGAAAAALGILLLSECPLTTGTEEENGVPGEDLQQRSDLFLQPEGASGQYVFFTNDPDLWGPCGCTLWTLTGKRQEPFAARELQLQKVSGDLSAGFGVVLCHREDPELGETMLVVLINARRQYTIGEVSGTHFNFLVPWTGCPALTDGYALNRLRLLSDGEGFELYFNGVLACRFLDEEEPLHAGGNDGLIVVISPLDRFPESAVHVVFQEQDP